MNTRMRIRVRVRVLLGAQANPPSPGLLRPDFSCAALSQQSVLENAMIRYIARGSPCRGARIRDACRGGFCTTSCTSKSATQSREARPGLSCHHISCPTSWRSSCGGGECSQRCGPTSGETLQYFLGNVQKLHVRAQGMGATVDWSLRRGLTTLIHDGEVGGANVEEDGEAVLVQYLDMLKNYEREGVPEGAGTDSDAGFDLERMQRLLGRLGDPLSSYPVVHVAGTKGKGSTVCFISNILRAAGFSVGTYTSPHIKSIRERITAGKSGEPITAEALQKLLKDVQATLDESVAAESGSLTHFEVLTALAFTHFAREKVDLAVVETGLGGSRDATNVISAEGLAAAVIVGIGSEHLAALGGSLESIACAKAGIIKHGRPVIVGRQVEGLAKDVIWKVAATKEAPVKAAFGSMAQCQTGLVSADSDHPFQSCNIVISDTSNLNSAGVPERWELKNLRLLALGEHQQDNALTAISTALSLRSQGWKIPDSSIRQGLEGTVIPGRFQVIESQHTKALGCLSCQLVLDGAHTEGSAVALAHTLKKAFPDALLALVVAMASDKDQHAFAHALLKEAKPDVVVTTRVPVAGSYKRSTSSSELAQCWIETGLALNTEVYSETEQRPVTYWDQGANSQDLSCMGKAADGINAQSADVATEVHSADRRKHLDSESSVLIIEVEPMSAAILKAAAILEQRCSKASQPQVVCVTGSLHGVAAAMALLSE